MSVDKPSWTWADVQRSEPEPKSSVVVRLDAAAFNQLLSLAADREETASVTAAGLLATLLAEDAAEAGGAT